MARKKRVRFHVALSDLEEPEISLKDLASAHGVPLREGNAEASDAPIDTVFSPSKLPRAEWEERGNILTQLEQKYCGHSKIRDTPQDAEGGKKRKRKSPADDEYDLDDDFIDDSDLLEVFEKQEQAENAITKYKGFFVNCGDLEISGHKESVVEPEKKPRKRVKKPKADKEKSPAAAGSGANVSGDESTSKGDDSKEEADEQAALKNFERYVILWRDGRPADEVSVQELPKELEKPALVLDLVLGEGSRRMAGGQISTSYLEKLSKVLNLSTSAWKKGLKNAAVARLTEIDEEVQEAKGNFRTLYNNKKENMANNSQKKTMEASNSINGAISPPPLPPVTKGVPVDNKLRTCLGTILTLLKEKIAIECLHPSPEQPSPKFEDVEMEVFTELANIWPTGSMKPQRLRKAHIDFVNKEKQRAEAALLKAAGNGGEGGGASISTLASAAGGGLGTTAGELNGIKKKPSGNRKVSETSSITGEGGGEKKPKKPRKKKETTPPIGGSAGTGDVQLGGEAAPSTTIPAAPVLSAAAIGEGRKAKTVVKKKQQVVKKAKKVKAKPKWPWMGVIVVPPSHVFRESDFEAEKVNER